MQYPNAPLITIKVAENGFTLESNGLSPISMVFTNAMEAVTYIDRMATDYRKYVEDYRKFQEERTAARTNK